MGLTPDIGFPDVIVKKKPVLRTYSLDLETGEIGRQIDGLDAIKQFVHKAIQTIRFAYPIYSQDYGCEVQLMLGKAYTQGFIQVEMSRMITEALVYDERINRVYDFEILWENDEVKAAFKVDSTSGLIRYEGVL
ncbi:MULTISPECIES: DUF2634 domain-containing protein [unclassified Paenibacillus]|uniref:DUF2634 domain-containing protein n=1 Tax=unclassified Paenibacillus TaxID=185978 RepID=UPI001042C8F6|nr:MULTISPECIES: DUF2634 domain-containing protein [unclassified Paenibacillus]NIK67105.1 phage baseplate assembly protein W [Paenibacillus sp. BK720]TCN01154.1 uncharacterized protein DUF2634 [Paenibacillus sp. BK033]